MQPTPTWMEYPAVNHERARCVICKGAETGGASSSQLSPAGKSLPLIAAATFLGRSALFIGEFAGTQPHAVAENEVGGSKFEPKAAGKKLFRSSGGKRHRH